ncbi:MAG TPA: TetR/AcrR family transcriptional regulator [Nocardioidaceae bacterium]|nr:TetR/AcrR family transcriptional regulator [Nocardioidaceae bacterium]
MPKVTDAHRAARRDQILGAAARCVAREGFHKTTMAAVIAEAGLSAGAVYGYFKSKNEIIKAIADRALGQAAHHLHDLVERDEPVHPADAVEVFLRQVTAPVVEGGVDLPRIAVQAWAEAVRDPEVHALAREKMLALRDALESVVLRCRRDGTLPDDLDPEQAAQVLFGLLPGFVLQRLILGDVTPESYVQGVRALLR